MKELERWKRAIIHIEGTMDSSSMEEQSVRSRKLKELYRNGQLSQVYSLKHQRYTILKDILNLFFIVAHSTVIQGSRTHYIFVFQTING
jgi:hypothetical protein